MAGIDHTDLEVDQTVEDAKIVPVVLPSCAFDVERGVSGK